MASRFKIGTNCTPRRVEPAGFVVAELVKDISQLTMITKLVRFVDYSVRHVTRRWESFGTTLPDSIRQHTISELSRHAEYWENATGRSSRIEGVDEVDSEKPSGSRHSR